MKINKWIVSLSALAIAIAIALLFVFQDNSIGSNILIGILASFIVSFVTGLANYFIERQCIIDKIKNAISNIYLNLLLIHDMMSEILFQIPYCMWLDRLNYKRLMSLAALNMDFAQQCSAELFSSFYKKGAAQKNINSFIDYTNKLYTLKHCLDKIEIAVLKTDILQGQIETKRNSGQIISEAENKEFLDRRNLVTVQTAKIHEYEASLLLELDKIAIGLYPQKGTPWNEKKEKLKQQSIKIHSDLE